MSYIRRTKIVCTIGPATESPVVLQRLIRAGMNVARLNFSHGTHAYHKKLFTAIRAASKKVGKPVAILQDLQGPRIRLGELSKEGVEVKKGEKVRFVHRTSPSPSPMRRGEPIPLAYPLYRFVKKGNTLLIDDGKLNFRVEGVHGKVIEAKVVVGGLVKSQKGVNTPGVVITAPALTIKDKEDLAFGLKLGVDFVTLSFVKEAKDLRLLRLLMKKLRPKVMPKVIAKLERSEAIKNLDAIVAETDAVMIGRGDLALETLPEDVPLLQKQIIEACLKVGKPVIVATQMLESMTGSPRPTRAEVSDVANAVIDHTDATMLSGETASGRYPVEAVTMMEKIITETEASRYDDVSDAVIAAIPVSEAHGRALAVRDLAKHTHAGAIIVAHEALLAPLVRLRPETPIFFVTQEPHIVRQALLMWNVQPILARSIPHTHEEWRKWALTQLKVTGHTIVVTETEQAII